MIDALEADWDERAWEDDDDDMANSMIVKYISSDISLAGRDRKILRAIFADGRAKSLSEFGEIWLKETKELKKDGDVKKAEVKIDIEADNYGDYMDEENNEDLEESQSDSAPVSPETGTDFAESVPDTSADLGGMDSIILRLRLLSLLSKVSAKVPTEFTDISTLYNTYSEQLRSLPIPAFFLITSPASLVHFPVSAASSLIQVILRSLISSSAPIPSSDYICQEALEMSFLPFAANTTSIADNTRVSLCVETLLRLLRTHAAMRWTPSLHEAAEVGIKARIAKAKKKQTKKGSAGNGKCDARWLTASAERIRMVVALVEQ